MTMSYFEKTPRAAERATIAKKKPERRNPARILPKTSKPVQSSVLKEVKNRDDGDAQYPGFRASVLAQVPTDPSAGAPSASSPSVPRHTAAPNTRSIQAFTPQSSQPSRQQATRLPDTHAPTTPDPRRIAFRPQPSQSHRPPANPANPSSPPPFQPPRYAYNPRRQP